MTGLLSGIRVLDLSQKVPGPFCSMILSDMGAEVIRIEDPDNIDTLRVMGRNKEGRNIRFDALNRGKKSAAIRLKNPLGLETLLRVIKQVDVVLEGSRPGAMKRRGLGYDELSRINPRLVYCSLSGFGQSGPCGMRGGHDMTYQAIAGTLTDSVQYGSTPIVPPIILGDLAGGALTAALAIVSALLSARTTGQGRYIDASILDGLLLLNLMGSSIAGSERRDPGQGERRVNGELACYNIYQTKDGKHMALGSIEPHFWQAFCGLIERPDLISDHMAMGGQDFLKSELQNIFVSKTRDEWAELSADVDCCLEPVLGPYESLNHPQVISRSHMYPVQSGDSIYNVPGLPPSIAGCEPVELSTKQVQTVPGVGEHTKEVLLEAGFTEQEIEQLKASNAVVSL